MQAGVISQQMMNHKSQKQTKIVLLAQVLIISTSTAACPDSFVSENRWSTMSPEWSSDVVFVIANFSLSNDSGGDVDFSSLSMAETIQAWVPIPQGANPYYNEIYEFDVGDLYFKTAPAGETHADGATISWDLAFDVSGAPLTYPRKISLNPYEGSVFGQFSYTMLSAAFYCSEGEPFYAEITAADVDLGEIVLTASAVEGSATITSYDATCEDSAGNTVNGSSASTSITVTDLDAGEDYTCIVTATNSVGTSVPSDATGILTPTSGGLPIWLLHEASTP
ncbi:MAG: hypothetical protein CME57_00460 [Halieaceae bacterium]|nr:hypothetical protein [Halieaceae bacterium]